MKWQTFRERFAPLRTYWPRTIAEVQAISDSEERRGWEPVVVEYLLCGRVWLVVTEPKR